MKDCEGYIVYPQGSSKIAFEGKHIYIYEIEPKPKTKVWRVYNYCNEILGEIRWLGQWRQYVLFSEKSIFGGSCFYEIAEFCKKQTQIQMKKEIVKKECVCDCTGKEEDDDPFCTCSCHFDKTVIKRRKQK